ncbi:zinc finger X-chromosomal protein-like isoform X2 [Haemaphysalis longicornis]
MANWRSVLPLVQRYGGRTGVVACSPMYIQYKNKGCASFSSAYRHCPKNSVGFSALERTLERTVSSLGSTRCLELTGLGSKSADFVCETCGKGFSSLDHLQDHRHCQHRERPARKHACAYCPYSSSNRSHVTRHERGHTGERPFVCQVCQKGYRRREDLEAHVRAHSRQR